MNVYLFPKWLLHLYLWAQIIKIETLLSQINGPLSPKFEARYIVAAPQKCTNWIWERLLAEI